MSRILVVCYEYPPLGGGGGRVAGQVAAALVERGHKVRCVTAGMPYLPRRSMVDGVEVIRVVAKRKREDTCTIFEMILWVVAALPVVLKEAWSWKPDVMHAHFAVPTGVVTWVVHQLTHIPYVLTAHLGDVPGGVPEQTDYIFKIIKPFTVPIWRSADCVTAVSSFVADLAEKAYGIRPRIILNGVKLLRNSISASHGITNSNLVACRNLNSREAIVPRLLMVGRLSIQKNPLFAIQALALLRDLSWTLHIIGEGPLFSHVQEEVRKLGLKNKVAFLGWLDADEVRRAMERSDLLLIPSLSEGLPMVGVEALAQGLAIVGSRIGGLRDVITEDHNGCFFDLEEGPESLAEVLRPLLKNQLLLEKMKNASLEKANEFEWDHSIDAYESVLGACTTSSLAQKHG
ncbi:MAG: glycosyltransferase family 4 protein [Chthoniobacterales bacterium]